MRNSLLILIVFILAVFLYLLPAIIANYYKRKNYNAILALNLLLGWTLLGWIISLIWALVEDKQ